MKTSDCLRRDAAASLASWAQGYGSVLSVFAHNPRTPYLTHYFYTGPKSVQDAFIGDWEKLSKDLETAIHKSSTAEEF